MRSRGLWILLLIIAIGLLALILRHDQGTIGGLETGDFASLVYKIALLIFIGGRVLSELLPGRTLSRGGTVEIARGNRGEFQIIVEINGARIPTVYDTG